MHTSQVIGQQRHAAKAIEDQIIQILNQKALIGIIQVSIKEYLHQSLVKKQKNGTGKLPQNNLRIIYANARGIKSKMQSLKQKYYQNHVTYLQ